MIETVTVEEAIRIGRKKVNVIGGMILIVTFLLCITVSIYISPFLLPIVLIVGCAICLIYRAITLVKWRIWAFENVRNVHELKQRAKLLNLIVEDNNILKSLEFSSAEQQERWLRIQQKFERPDVFNEDYNVPAETVVYFSIWKNLAWLILFVPILAVGIFLLVTDAASSYISGTLTVLFAGGMCYVFINNAMNRKPRMTLNNEGLTTYDHGFFKWQEISNPITEIQHSGRYSRAYLTYSTRQGKLSFLLDDFTISRSEIDHLLIVYKGRAD